MTETPQPTQARHSAASTDPTSAPLERERAPDRKQVPARGSEMHLLSCVGERDAALVAHFVGHYEALGVPRERMHLIVHVGHGDLEGDAAAPGGLVGEVMGDLGLEPAMIWRGHYTSAGLWQRRRGLQRRVVPADGWVLNADIDELHSYPAPLREVVAHLDEEGLNLLQGPMLDRVAPGGVLAPVEPYGVAGGRRLSEQFPIVADVMCPLGAITRAEDADGTVKMMLHRASVLPGIGGHNPWVARHGPWRREGVAYAAGRPLAHFADVVDPAWRFAQPAAVHHYKWTEGLAESLTRRRDAAGASARGSAYGSAVLDHLEAHGGRVGIDEVPVHEVPVREVPVRRTGPEDRLPRRLLRRPLRRFRAPGDDQDRDRDWRAHLAEQRATPPRPLPATPRVRPLSDEPPRVAAGWRVRRLTDGTSAGRFHTHSYYDIPVLDDTRTLVAAVQSRIEDRWMTPEDAVSVGVVDLARGGFEPVAETTAWSWQQGPLAQWVPGTRQLVWNHREGNGFIARLHDVETGTTRTLPRSIYALAPDGLTALGLDMARLSRARPGYGYFGADTSRLDRPGPRALAPEDDGVWQVGLRQGDDAPRLLLSLAEAVTHLHSTLAGDALAELTSTRHLYWFNHVKLSPDGGRFTVKLRWRVATLEKPWKGTNSVSLTAAVDGSDVRVLAVAASHVMWRDAGEVVLWDEVRTRVSVVADHASGGELLRDLPPEVFDRNVHIHPLRARPGHYLYDVPYASTVQLRTYDETTGTDQQLAELERHDPAHGPFRCDLHPVPTPDGQTTIFTSLHDGGRQVYVLERDR